MKDIESVIQLNRRQATFYDSISAEEDIEEQTGYATHERANVLTRTWAALRYQQQRAFSQSGLEAKKSSFLQRWIERKRGGAFLEIGCFRGTCASFPLIEMSGRYLGIDLSRKAVEAFMLKIENAGFRQKATAIAADFLVFDDDRKYDVVFAHGVLHHFEDPDPLFRKIRQLLADDGILLFTEPSSINVVFRVIRAMYRPFQSDKAWEWPFTEATVSVLERYFRPLEGFGWGRLSLFASVLTGLPLLGSAVRPVYLRLLNREIRDGWSERVWLNSTVTAAYAKRDDRADI